MRPTRQLIDAFRSAAQKIRDPDSGYNWNQPSDCNCGILAQELQVSKPQIISLVNGFWTNNANASFCPQTGIALNLVFQTLANAGLEQKDFDLIENRIPGGRNNRQAVAAQFEIWAHELEQQLVRQEQGQRVAQAV